MWWNNKHAYMAVCRSFSKKKANMHMMWLWPSLAWCALPNLQFWLLSLPLLLVYICFVFSHPTSAYQVTSVVYSDKKVTSQSTKQNQLINTSYRLQLQACMFASGQPMAAVSISATKTMTILRLSLSVYFRRSLLTQIRDRHMLQGPSVEHRHQSFKTTLTLS